jgi:putative transposase
VVHIHQRGEGKKSVKKKRRRHHPTRRWVIVERTNSWHNRFRKLLVRYKKKAENYLGLIHLSCCITEYQRIILG